MKLKYIIAVLVLLLLTVGTASAEEVSYELDDGTSDSASYANLKVTATYGDDYIIFTAVDLNTGGPADIKEIGFNIDPSKVLTIQDDTGQMWYPDPKNDPLSAGQMDGLGDYLTDAKIPNEKIKTDVVTVTFNSGLTDTVINSIVKNDHGFETCVHAAWNDGESSVSGDNSAYVAGYIPEFPTIAAPVAAILGLMFIFGRKKQK